MNPICISYVIVVGQSSVNDGRYYTRPRKDLRLGSMYRPYVSALLITMQGDTERSGTEMILTGQFHDSVQ